MALENKRGLLENFEDSSRMIYIVDDYALTLLCTILVHIVEKNSYQRKKYKSEDFQILWRGLDVRILKNEDFHLPKSLGAVWLVCKW